VRPDEHLDTLAGVIRLWLEALLHRSAREPEGEGALPRTRYAIAAAEVVKLLTEAGRADAPALTARAETAWRALPQDTPLAVLVRGLGLDDAAARVIAVLAAIDRDPALERACAYAWDDFTRKRPDVGFLIDLLGPEARAALAPSAPLRQLRVVVVGAPGDADTTPPMRRTARLADRVLAHLSGDDAMDLVLEGVAELVAPAALADLVLDPASIAHARAALADPRARVLLFGPAGAGKLLLVRALADAPVLRVDVAELVRFPDRLDDRMARVSREAGLRGAVVVLAAGAGLDEHLHGPVIERLIALSQRIRGAVVWSGHARPRWLVHAVPQLREIEVPGPTLGARVELWRRALGDTPVADDALEEIAGRFALGGGAIVRAAERALVQARLRDPGAPRLALPELTESARMMLQHRLGSVARRITPGFDWDDLVLPEETHEALRELLDFARHRAALLERWGFDRKLPYGRGVSAVMAGPPGTGKTMVAQLLARELGYDLYLIELAQVVNKYIGETEKNLARVFDEAEASHAILFFDEADALFAKRTDVKSSNDRYANLEVNYLLQRMESYNGITLLATNLEQGLDEAFKRRIRFSIRFEMPEAPVREQLWRSMFPAEVPLAPDIAWKQLAEKWDLAGGHIKKAALRAAARAITRGKDATITGEDLELAAQLEYREMGRVG